MSEQFENIIRKKLQEAEPPFDPDAWEKMKKRLDDSDRRRPVLWWWVGGLLLLFTGAGSWWWLANRTQDKIVPVAKEERVIAKDSNNSSSSSQQKVSSKITPLERATQSATENKNEQRSPVKTISQKANEPVPFLGSTKHPAAEKITVNKAPAFDAVDKKMPVDNKVTSVPAQTNPLPVKKDQPVNAIVDSLSKQQTDALKTERKIKKPQRKGFDGGITLGPDFNIASSLKMGRIGMGAGILLRYHINNKWYLSTGAVYTKKIYGATSTDYSTPYPVNFTKIDANCNVLDVPLNVHYTFAEHPRSTWSVMAGASSYFMVKEKYEYYYPNDVKRSREYNNENQHYFSVLNLGVNWEKKTTGRLKWGLQPYVKVPLGGVGQGKVRLYSAGINLQLTMGKKD